MKETLEANDVPVEFATATEDRTYVGYRTHRRGTDALFSEFRFVVETVLDLEPGKPVTGVTFHTNHPLIVLWTVEAEWAEGYRRDELPATALLAEVMHTVESVHFG